MTRPTRLTPHILGTLALLAWGLAPVELASGTPLRVRETLRNDLPSRAEYDRMERGYYEQIIVAGHRLDAPVGALRGHAEPFRVEHERLTLRVDDIREYLLKPNMTMDPGRRIPWSTNAQGMRDRAYSVDKPRDTFRIALVGDSIASGWAVGNEEGFEPRLERGLAAQARAAGGMEVEVLNFAVPGHGPGQRWCHFDKLGWKYSPDLVLFEATPADPGWDERRLRVLLARGVGFDEPVYREVLEASGIRPGSDTAAYRRTLRPLRWELLAGVYRKAVAECRDRGVPAIWVLVPRVGKLVDRAERTRLVSLAREAGFDAVIDVCDAYDGADPSTLAIGPNDFHPNAEGHARIARLLEAALAGRPELAPLWTSTTDRNARAIAHGRTQGVASQ